MRTVLLSIAVLVVAATALAQTYVTENITTDTTWDIAGSPYVVQGEVRVISPHTLTVEPGVTVKMDSMAQLTPYNGGVLHAVGTEGNEILFTSVEDTPAPNDWYGVVLRQSSASVMTHCVVEYGRNNIYANQCDPTITNCTIRFAENSGILNEVSSTTITGCLVTENGTGVRVSDGNPIITGCTISNNYRGVYLIDSDTDPVVNNCNIVDNASSNIFVYAYDGRPIVTLNFENNWWGVDTAPEIEATIDIHSSSVGFVEVDFDPWLHEVPVEAISWGRIKTMYLE